MKILLWIMCFMAIPSICSAHSGTLINAVSNYMPLIIPMVFGAVATCRNYIKTKIEMLIEWLRNK